MTLALIRNQATTTVLIEPGSNSFFSFLCILHIILIPCALLQKTAHRMETEQIICLLEHVLDARTGLGTPYLRP